MFRNSLFENAGLQTLLSESNNRPWDHLMRMKKKQGPTEI